MVMFSCNEGDDEDMEKDQPGRWRGRVRWGARGVTTRGQGEGHAKGGIFKELGERYTEVRTGSTKTAPTGRENMQ